MSETNRSTEELNPVNKPAWLRRILGRWEYWVGVAGIVITIAMCVGIIIYWDEVRSLQNYSYLGAFIISLTFNATLVLPAGNIFVLALLGGVLPSAVVVGLVGGAGAALGEITGYLAGYSGRGLAEQSRVYERVEEWMRRWGTLTVLVMSVVPLVFDLVGIAAGVLRFPFWKFLLFCWLGRTILYVGVALAGAWGWELLLG